MSLDSATLTLHAELILGQTECSVISFAVARMPACESSCNFRNMRRQQALGTKRRLLPVKTSQIIDKSEKGVGIKLRTKFRTWYVRAAFGIIIHNHK